MTNYLLPIFALLIAGCGSQSSKQKTATQPTEITTESIAKPNVQEKDQEILQDSTSESNEAESLNDIRFGNWTDEDWQDNDYFRTLRKYVDAYLQGKIKNKDLTSYQSILKSKFVIYNVEPFIAGGLFVSVVFLDDPNTIFDAWIYSDVNETTRKITNYQVKGLKAREDEHSEMTKEEIMAIIKEHPENKLW